MNISCCSGEDMSVAELFPQLGTDSCWKLEADGRLFHSERSRKMLKSKLHLSEVWNGAFLFTYRRQTRPCFRPSVVHISDFSLCH